MLADKQVLARILKYTFYDDIKAVKSIWICMDASDENDSINRFSFTQESIYGNKMELTNLHKMQGIIIRIRKIWKYYSDCFKNENTDLLLGIDEVSPETGKDILLADYSEVNHVLDKINKIGMLSRNDVNISHENVSIYEWIRMGGVADENEQKSDYLYAYH